MGSSLFDGFPRDPLKAAGLAVDRWAGDGEGLRAATRLPGLDDACPPGRTDAVADALRALWAAPPAARVGASRRVRQVLRERVRVGERAQALSDPALHLWLRERSLALLVRGAVSVRGGAGDHATRARSVLGDLYRLYPPEEFPLALVDDPPDPASPGVDAAVVIFPGVVRTTSRTEFAAQMTALSQQLAGMPVLRVDTGSFMDPAANADQALADIATLPRTAVLHLVGYSQGARNALQALVRHREIAGRARTLFALNSAARGSEVADLLRRVALLLGEGDDQCSELPPLLRAPCAFLARQSPFPSEPVIGALAMAMGVPPSGVQEFIRREDGVQSVHTLGEFFRRHSHGVLSLTTAEGERFWREEAPGLPREVLYASFRSVVKDRGENLPPSNRIFFELLRLADRASPWNDMQVRLANQSLGGPIADREVVWPVAEGNHWQWELGPDDLPTSLMPRSMSERIPRDALIVAHFQALAEVGLLS